MPRGKKSPENWYARAQQYRAIADALQSLEKGLHESKTEHSERYDVVELVRRQLLRESERCWREGGRIDVARRSDQQAKPEVQP